MRTSECESFQELLVDYAAGTVAAADAARVEGHCASCAECAKALAALREVPLRLRGAGEPPAPDWALQRARILAAVDDIAAASAAASRGVDARLLLPVAAALVIAVAGVLSLRSSEGANARPARVALQLVMEDPVVVAELSEVLGEPVLMSAPLWDEQGEIPSGNSWVDGGSAGEPPSLDELGEQELLEIERMLGV